MTPQFSISVLDESYTDFSILGGLGSCHCPGLCSGNVEAFCLGIIEKQNWEKKGNPRTTIPHCPLKLNQAQDPLTDTMTTTLTTPSTITLTSYDDPKIPKRIQMVRPGQDLVGLQWCNGYALHWLHKCIYKDTNSNCVDIGVVYNS